MVYKILNIAQDVRIAIDENKTSEQLIADEDIDTLSLDEIIRSKIVEAVRRVLTIAPLHLLDGGVPFGDAVYWRDKGSGWILLPDDFMRLMIFKMSDWERPVYEAISADDPRYGLQFSRYKGIRGTPQKPIVAIVSRAEGRALELFSCKDNTATVEQAIYFPLPKEDEHGGIAIPERCYESVVYEAASLVAYAMEQRDQGVLLSDLGKQLSV
ncbi:MAG: hypothetical protein HDR86_03610 [Bacteroides sp.]|nr:hypothetical protein [Bacteroides sp.]